MKIFYCENPYQKYLHTPRKLGNSNSVESIKLLDFIHFFLILIFIRVIWWVIKIITLFNYKANKKPAKFNNHNSYLERAWTLLPAVIIIIRRIPSFNLLYLIDEYNKFERSLKIIGHQWYWAYELETPLYTVEFDTGLLQLDDLVDSSNKRYRIASTSAIILPIKTSVRALISSEDVRSEDVV